MSSKYRINSIQNAALAITGAVRRTSREEIRQQRRWNKISFSTTLVTKPQIFFSKLRKLSPTLDKTWLF